MYLHVAARPYFTRPTFPKSSASNEDREDGLIGFVGKPLGILKVPGYPLLEVRLALFD